MTLNLPLLALVGSWAAAIGGIWILCSAAAAVVTPKIRARITQWLKNLDPPKVAASWPTIFVDIFDSVFGKKHLSWQCFWKSCVASLLATVVMTLIFAATQREEWAKVLQMMQPQTPFPFSALPVFFFFSVILNLFPDYLSLLESRAVIHWMAAQPSKMRIGALLLLDASFTVLLFVVALAVVIASMHAGFDMLESEELDEILEDDVKQIIEGLSYRRIPTILWNGLSLSAPIGVYFYTTFFTSIWVWLFALSGLVVRFMAYLGGGIGRFRASFDIDNKPIQSLGFVSMLLVTLIYLGVGFYILVGSS